MLTIKFEAENAVVAKIYTTLALDEAVCGTNFVMYDANVADDTSNPVALFRVKLDCGSKNCGANVKDKSSTIAVVDKIVFLDSVHIDDKNFFVRAMFFKLQGGANMVLQIRGLHSELKKFGFEEIDGNMEVETSKIELHSSCCGKH